jgi:hypothetical protein
MFISKSEKEQLQKDIKSLAQMVQDLSVEMTYLRALVKADKTPKEVKKVSGRQPRTPEQKAKQSAYMKAWHAKNREKKLATA